MTELRGKALYDAVIEQIDREPESWHQGYWGKQTACGTSFCVAGWAVVLAYPDAVFEWTQTADEGDRRPVFQASEVTVNGELNTVSAVASRLLFSDVDDPDLAEEMFLAGNSRDNLDWYASLIWPVE